MRRPELVIDPKLDLVFERRVDLPPEKLWAGWTQPERLKQWFSPEPWKTVECEIDLKPGGLFRTVMRSPEGQEFENVGCYLEMVPNERLVWTDALLPGYRPSGKPFITAIISFEAEGKGTKYRARLLHEDEEGRQQHEEMGFQEGWGKAFDQLVAHLKKS